MERLFFYFAAFVVPGAGELGPVGLLLDFPGTDDLHIRAGDLRLGLDLLCAEELLDLAVHGDKRLARRAVDGVPARMASSIWLPVCRGDTSAAPG